MRVRWANTFSLAIRQRPGESFKLSMKVVAASRLFLNAAASARIKGRRELVFAPFPYIAVYKIKEREQLVEISRIYHGAQNWR